jgi:hypothetical protein
MHRKEVRLRCYYFCALFFSLPDFNFSIIMLGLRAPWDPGIMYGTLPKEEGHAKVQVPRFTHLYNQVSKLSYMATKKALYWRQPG